MTPAMARLEANFGSFERWRDEFIALRGHRAPTRTARWRSNPRRTLVIASTPELRPRCDRRCDRAFADRARAAPREGAPDAPKLRLRLDWAARPRYRTRARGERALQSLSGRPRGSSLSTFAALGGLLPSPHSAPVARWLDRRRRRVGRHAPADRDFVVYCVTSRGGGDGAAAARAAAGALPARRHRGWQAAGTPSTGGGEGEAKEVGHARRPNIDRHRRPCLSRASCAGPSSSTCPSACSPPRRHGRDPVRHSVRAYGTSGPRASTPSSRAPSGRRGPQPARGHVRGADRRVRPCAAVAGLYAVSSAVGDVAETTRGSATAWSLRRPLRVCDVAADD